MSSSGGSNSTIGCNSFKPHQLKPDKCRNCFGDKSKHENAEKPTSDTNNADKTKPQGDQEKDKLIEQCQAEIAKLREELRVAQQASNGGQQSCQHCQTYRSQLEDCKSKCQSLEKERDQLREELRALEREMEEMHDTFKEEESEQFEQTKQELDLAMKNCKILQIRLHKAERQYGQLEQVKLMLEQQLEQQTNNNNNTNSATRLEQQDNSKQVSFTQIGSDSVKLSTLEYDKLLKDLSDTFEREKDLQEQIKYSQEEAQLKSDRLQSVEGENEILLNKVSKLTLANSRLRASLHQSNQRQQQQQGQSDSGVTTVSDLREATEERSELIQEIEQLKLALEFAQSDGDRTKGKLQEAQTKLDSLKDALQSSETKRIEFEAELNRLKLRRQSSFSDAQAADSGEKDAYAALDQARSKLELECRQLRSKLVQSERENRQLKLQQSSARGQQQPDGEQRTTKTTFMSVRGMSVPKSHSMDMSFTSSSPAPTDGGSEQARYRELNRQLREQCDSLREQNERLEQRIEDITLSHSAGGQSNMESDLLEKLKRRLDFSESELAKVRSRLVEMDLECSRVQRQHKRLVESLENSNTDSSGLLIQRRKVKLPAESMRDSMSRQELRQAVRELEEELDECFALLRAKDCLITERASEASQQQQAPASVSTCEEQVKSLRRLLEQERLLSNNLKIDVSSLEETKQELLTNTMMLERERVAMEEELDKLRALNIELNTDIEDLKRINRSSSNRIKDLQVSHEKSRADLLKLQQRQKRESSASPAGGGSSPLSGCETNDMLLMARDLSELKVKNGFLMRQLEIAREESTRQMEDLRQAHEIQQRRCVEMAQIELRERHLSESQQLRDELNELKQKLATVQRQLGRQEEEMAGERDRLRGQERDWRREKSQLQQKIEQLEAQLSLERRSNEFRVKEIESSVREKERDLINLQDKCVQLERDLKRTQNKYSLLEENSESKQKTLAKELEVKKRELSDLIATNHARDEQYFEQCKRFNSEKSTLSEALESLRRSYDEKLAELKSSRDLLSLRQDQSFKERLAAQEKLDDLSGQLLKMSEYKTQARLFEQQLQTHERQVESLRRDCMQMKEDKLRLKTRCDDFEARCSQYEKQELITKTSSISSSSSSNLFARAKQSLSPSGSSTGRKLSSSAVAARAPQQQSSQQEAGSNNNQSMIERLTSKINDQRHLINMLKEQYESAQLELKQMKLVQSAERHKWQNLASQLQSRLNECEEKLLFETSLNNQTTFDNCRRKFELKWSEERKNTLDLMQQQQAQIEILVRDFKKISQQHDLLRLHAKQLESNNQKLSKKLIEFQQNQQQTFRLGQNQSAADQQSQRMLSDCLAEKETLRGQQSELRQLNSSLLELLRNQVRPLVETVNKIMAAIESSDQHKTDDVTSKRPNSTINSNNNSSGFSLRHGSADEASSGGQSRSTLRPLMTSKQMGGGESGNQIDSSSPAHHQVAPQQSRLLRLFSGTSKSPSPSASVDPQTGQDESTKSPATRVVKKVRVKSAALGITPSEKRQLKERLGELSKAIEGLSRAKTSANRSVNNHLDHHSIMSNLDADGSSASASTNTTQATAGRVHWQLDNSNNLDSDLESERSWSLQAPDSSSRSHYRRFPQTTPSSHRAGASLTDYESESSLAGSDLSLSAVRRVAADRSGVESDSCMKPTSASTGRRRGLKSRFTDTLRNISRSITGLASDSESESIGGGASSRQLRLKRTKDATTTKSLSASTQTQPSVAGGNGGGDNLKEIRV